MSSCISGQRIWRGNYSLPPLTATLMHGLDTSKLPLSCTATLVENLATTLISSLGSLTVLGHVLSLRFLRFATTMPHGRQKSLAILETRRSNASSLLCDVPQGLGHSNLQFGSVNPQKSLAIVRLCICGALRSVIACIVRPEGGLLCSSGSTIYSSY